jgi:chemotaxis signal transduction protein
VSLDAVADIELTVGSPPADAEPPAPLPLERAQSIDCGGVRIALPFTWARNIVESFVLSAAPLAPAWLAGAANIDGQIVPVVDLAAWLDAGQAQAIDRKSRLLLGGSGDDAFALLFSGLPALVRWAPAGADAQTPAALRAHVVGAAVVADADQQAVPVIDMAALGQAWVSELSV